MRKTLGFLTFLAVCSSVVAAPPVKVKGMKIADFEKLPDDATLDLEGRTLTKRALLAEVAKASGAPGTPLLVEADKLKAKFVQDQRAGLEAQNAPVLSKARALASKFKATDRPALSASKAPPLNVALNISSVEPQALQPGGNLLLHGIGFGEEPGKIFMTGSFGTRDVSAQTGWPHWFPTEAYGQMPGSLVAIAQTVTLVVETKDGRRSAPVSVPFHPSRAQTCSLLTLSSVTWPHGPTDTCAMHSYGPGYIGPSVRCEHTSPPSGYVSVGTDRVSMTLKNGWVFDSYSLGTHPMGQSMLQKEIVFFPGTPGMSASFLWAVTGSNGRVWWDMVLCASGPNDGLPKQ